LLAIAGSSIKTKRGFFGSAAPWLGRRWDEAGERPRERSQHAEHRRFGAVERR
jgi:hypothetical protein